MTAVGLDIVDVHRDRQMQQRMRTGKYRITHELNEEWVDLQNNGPYVLNLQGRLLVCARRLTNGSNGYNVLRQAKIRSHATIPMQPGDKVRIYTGEQPSERTKLTDTRIRRVLWLVQTNYLWLADGNEVHLYFSEADMRQGKGLLSRFILG